MAFPPPNPEGGGEGFTEAKRLGVVGSGSDDSASGSGDVEEAV